MIKIYCDLCGNDIKGTIYRGQFFRYDQESHTCGHLEREVEVCQGCLDNILNGWKREIRQKFTEPEEPKKKGLSIEIKEPVDPIAKYAEKYVKEAAKAEKADPPAEIADKSEKKKALKEAVKKSKTRKEDPEDDEWTFGKSRNLDDGKIWALAHAKVPWTLKEIAEEMGCSASTILNHLKRMREERGED